jgi:hypothetical protein
VEGVPGKDKPLVAGGLFFAMSVAGFLGNVVGGRLMEISYTAAFVPAGGLVLIGTLLTWMLWVRTAPVPRDEFSNVPLREPLPEAA